MQTMHLLAFQEQLCGKFHIVVRRNAIWMTKHHHKLSWGLTYLLSHFNMEHTWRSKLFTYNECWPYKLSSQRRTKGRWKQVIFLSISDKFTGRRKCPGRFRWSCSLRRMSVAARLLGLLVRIPLEHECLCLVNVVCLQFEITKTGWFLVQRTPTECVVYVCVCVCVCVCVSVSVIRCDNNLLHIKWACRSG